METRISPETNARIARAWPEVLAAIADGAEVGKALTAAGISRDMIRAYWRDVPGSRVQWDQAREQSADAFFDQAHEIANNAGGDPNLARVRLDALKWLARVRNPRVYSDKSQVDVNVRTVDLTRIILDANARLAAARAPTPEPAADIEDAVILPPLAIGLATLV